MGGGGAVGASREGGTGGGTGGRTKKHLLEIEVVGLKRRVWAAESKQERRRWVSQNEVRQLVYLLPLLWLWLLMNGKGRCSWHCKLRQAKMKSLLFYPCTFKALAEVVEFYRACLPEKLRYAHIDIPKTIDACKTFYVVALYQGN